MKTKRRVCTVTLVAAGISFLPPATGSALPAEGMELVGPLSRQQVEAVVVGWGREAAVNDRLEEVIEKMVRVPPRARVKIFFGTWCHDSMQEVPRLMRLLDRLEGREPFRVEFFGVDKKKTQPSGEIRSHQVHFLPTVIVTRQSREIGRIVQRPARTIETDLLRLLDGTAEGLLSSNETVILDYLRGPRQSGYSSTPPQ